MDLYLIRHGETVDNVAGLYAGVRDSALTNHGVEQARRLGDYFARTSVRFTHIFSSPLSRAWKTAQSIEKCQEQVEAQDGDTGLVVSQVANLIEQDFGFYEGKPFHARSEAKRSGKEGRLYQRETQPGFVDVESKESMGRRADGFIDEHLLPLFRPASPDGRRIVAIVSHGIFLGNLWRRLLRRLPRKSVTSQEVLAHSLEHLGGWSNTGYLHLSFSRSEKSIDAAAAAAAATASAHSRDSVGDERLTSAADKAGIIELELDSPQLHGWLLNILSIDSKLHLVGLKRQRGGIGRLAHDEGQRKLDGFFKRQRTS